MRLSPMPCSVSAWDLHTLWRNVILILIFICHSPCAMCYSPFAIPTAAFSPASGGGGMWHVCFHYAFWLLFGFAVCACATFAAVATIVGVSTQLIFYCFCFYLHLSTFCACYSFIGFDVSWRHRNKSWKSNEPLGKLRWPHKAKHTRSIHKLPHSHTRTLTHAHNMQTDLKNVPLDVHSVVRQHVSAFVWVRVFFSWQYLGGAAQSIS